mgnify:FL=1|jgi:hypothetical protein
MEDYETKCSNTKPDSITYDELFSGLSSTGIYSHLQILLHREHTITKPEFGRKFLMVSPNTFGLVKLNDLYLCDDHICLELEDVITGITNPVFVPVYDKHFRFVLITWEDVVAIVHQDNITKSECDNELLEFNY